jgi:hypothetical protein
MKKIIMLLVFFVSLIILTNIKQGGDKELPPKPITPIPSPVPPAPTPPKKIPGDSVKWMDFQPLKNRTESTPFLTDIENHLPVSMGSQYRSNDPITHAHETTHGINSYLRNTYGNDCYYIGNNKAVTMKGPKITITQIRDNIPQNLRGSRYQLYLVSQAADWNSQPLYIFDEWTAYDNGSAVGLEVKKNTNLSSDDMVACLEFSNYAIALAITIKKHDPEYLKTNTQFKEFLAFELRRSLKIYKTGIVLPQFKWDTQLETNLRANQEFHDILNELYGSDLTIEKLLTS